MAREVLASHLWAGDTSDASHKTQNAAGTITSCNLGRVGSHECAELMGIHALEVPWAGNRPGGSWEHVGALARTVVAGAERACDTLFECNQSAPSDRVSNRYWKPRELCAGNTLGPWAPRKWKSPRFTRASRSRQMMGYKNLESFSAGPLRKDLSSRKQSC